MVTRGKDRWGNPTFTVGLLTITAYPRHSDAQFHVSDYDYRVLRWVPEDLRQIAAAFNEAAEAAEGEKCGLCHRPVTECVVGPCNGRKRARGEAS